MQSITRRGAVAGLTMLAVGAGFGAETSARTLVVAHVLQEDHPYHLMALRFQEELAAKDVGLTVEIFPAGQLGNERTLLEALQTGAVDITTVTSALTANFVPEFAALSLPFIFNDADHLFAAMDGEVGEVLSHALRREGFVKLGYGYGGVRDLYTHSPVASLDDLSGKRVRTMESAVIIEAWERLGAAPTPVAWGDVYVALQQRLVDGGEGTGVSYRSMGFDALAPHFTQINYIFSWHNFIMSAGTFDALSAAQQEAVLAAGDVAVRFQRDVFLEQEEALLAELRERGVTIHQVADFDRWIERIEPIFEAKAPELGGIEWIDRIRNAQ
ncbi:MAG: TRAP transporter substrate-binding protein [Geminicoccaceae bacterium]|nr:MAG: TRAP transporter substrate-binding protein [Geminicoccaceae bacterium]